LHRRGNGDAPLKLHKGRNGTFLMGGKDGTVISGHVINGCWTLDKKFDGKTHALPPVYWWRRRFHEGLWSQCGMAQIWQHALQGVIA
jgi:hypothetical protein